jgi:DNA-binding HxlR family transcriptional regulator
MASSLLDGGPEMGACIPLFQYALSGKYQRKKEVEMKRGAFTCGLDAALFVLGGKWKPLILYHLAHGTRRYGELRRTVGNVSDKVLIQQLKELQADGVIDRVDFGEIPPKVEYSLTAFGKTLGKALAPLCEWGTKYSRDVEAIMARRKAREHRHAA